MRIYIILPQHLNFHSFPESELYLWLKFIRLWLDNVDCTSLALQVAPVSYYCLIFFIGLRPKLGNTHYHINLWWTYSVILIPWIKKTQYFCRWILLKLPFYIDVIKIWNRNWKVGINDRVSTQTNPNNPVVILLSR